MNNLPFKLKLLLALLLGALLTFAYAPFSFWPIIFVILPLFIYLLQQTAKQHYLKLGYAFGLGWFGSGMSWVHVSIADFGGLPLIGSLALMLLLCGYLAIYPALACYCLGRYFKASLWPLSFPFIWLASEFLRSWILTGLPWLSLGYSQINGVLAGWLPVIGEFGVTSLIIILSSALAIWLPQKKWTASILLCVVVCISGVTLERIEWTTKTGKFARISMVQGNIEQAIRWTPKQDKPTMDKYLSMTAEHWQSNDVIIWPEAAIPQLEPIALDYLHQLDTLAANSQTGMITGIVNYNFDTREAYNNLVGLGLQKSPSLPSDGEQQSNGHYHYLHANRFSKHHLLPFGEFIPLEDWIRGIAPIFDLPMSSFSRGDYQQSNIQAKGFNFAPAICFEIAFPRQISQNLYFNTDFIITVSNDAWFGDSHGPAQHLEIAQVRAKEFGLPVLRSTNNGITAFINHKGQIQSRLPQFEAAVLSDSIPLVEGKTPYRQLGDWPIWIFTLVLFLWALKKQIITSNT